MIEKVAAAMQQDDATRVHAYPEFNAPWDRIEPKQQEIWRSHARAALEAMREPTEAQYAALSATGKMWRELDSKTVWQTYIDAALNAKDPAPIK